LAFFCFRFQQAKAKMAATALTTASESASESDNTPRTRSEGSKIMVYWTIPETATEHVAISVQLATNDDFTAGVRTFVIPANLKGVGLDVGNGKWFVRVGFWKGNAAAGHIIWSKRTAMAEEVRCAKAAVPVPKTFLPVIHTTPQIERIRFHFSNPLKRYVVYETCPHTSFSATSTVTRYKLHSGADFDVGGLTALVPANIRLCTLATLDQTVLPTESVEMLGGWSAALNKRPLKKPGDLDGMSTVERLAMDAVIKHADTAVAKGEKPRFSSHADYVRYQAAMARLGRT
jgi:hypothetical protein